MHMDKQDLHQFIEDLYKDADGFSISDEGQNALPYYFRGYEYGESSFDSFYDILLKTRIQPGETFYDLGSGLGKKVLITSLGFRNKKSIGIEAIDTLHHAAKRIINDNSHAFPFLAQQSINLECGDFLSKDISDGDVFYISIAPAILEGYLSGRLLAQLLKTRIGTRIITSNIIIPSKKFEVELAQESLYTGGKGIMYLHRKID